MDKAVSFLTSVLKVKPALAFVPKDQLWSLFNKIFPILKKGHLPEFFWMFDTLRSLTRPQWHVVAACYLGWTLDAFDFFILVFLLKDIAAEFETSVKAVTLALTLTLALRPLGALTFGLLADHFGRRPLLIINILTYSIIEAASGFAPSLTSFIILRALYGIAMGGEWGVGAALAFESIPPRMRGLVSGILQTGYPSGYLLASLVYYFLFPIIGWRGLFIAGIIPAFLVLYIRRSVEESPTFLSDAQVEKGPSFWVHLKKNRGLFLWAVLMMTCFNFLSHGTQDLYPTFLQQQRGLSSYTVGIIAIIYNIGAILGGLAFGIFSSKYGRRRTIIIAALCTLPIIPLWTEAKTNLGLTFGAFFIQFFVQGAWGVVPVHLNELSPASIRGVFPGVVYQLGNLFASLNATLQASFASSHEGNYALALSLGTGIVTLILAAVVGFGREARDRSFDTRPTFSE